MLRLLNDGVCCFRRGLYTKEYLLNVSAMRRYSLFNVKKSAARSCQGTLGISQGSTAWMACLALYCV